MTVTRIGDVSVEPPDDRITQEELKQLFGPDIAALVLALEEAADFIKDQDEGDPTTKTGWKSEEYLDAWMNIQLAISGARMTAQVEPVERSPIVNQNAVVWYSDNDGPDDIPTSVLGDCDFCDARNVEVVSTGRATVDWTPVACPSCRSRT